MTSSEQPFVLKASPGFPGWLAATGGSLAFTTYQAGKLFLIGTLPDHSLSVFERSFDRAMGLAVSADGRRLALAMRHQIQRFDDLLAPGQRTADAHDALFGPHAAWVTGDLDIHDLGWDTDGRPVFVNTLFNCIATVSDGHSFRELWRPPFISRLVPEDRCHLNGMAMADGAPVYASAVSRSDVLDGWRDRRRNGGVVIDVATGEIAAHGLSMPHSPRLYDGRLWLLNSGEGAFGTIDAASGRFEGIAFCPGYARGLTFVDGLAVIGLSLARDNNAFEGLALDDALAARDTAPRCGLVVIDPRDGATRHWVRIEGVVRELFDVAFLPGRLRPSLIGYRTGEIDHVLSIAP